MPLDYGRPRHFTDKIELVPLRRLAAGDRVSSPKVGEDVYGTVQGFRFDWGVESVAVVWDDGTATNWALPNPRGRAARVPQDERGFHKPAVARAIERSKQGIQEDVDNGRMPEGITDFALLHDHVDANDYGDLSVLSQGEASEVQEAVHRWLAANPTKRSPDLEAQADATLAAIGEALYEWLDEQKGTAVECLERVGEIIREGPGAQG